MAMRTCGRCHYVWDGSQSPFCPACIEHDWDNSAGFIRPKHDPRLIPNVYKDYRSIVTMDFITNQDEYINALAYNGEYYYDTQYGNYTCFLNQPLGSTAGSGIPPNYPWPTHPLDSQKVVDVYGSPHVYAVDWADVAHEVSVCKLIPSNYCDVAGCSNLAIPGTTKCSRH